MGRKSDSGQLSETPQERALMEMSLQRYQQYKEKWQPVQQQAIGMVNKMGAAGSMERRRAVSREAGGVGAEFDEAIGKADDLYGQRGIDLASGNAKMGMGKLDSAKAGATGIAAAGAESEIDKAYVEGLTQIMSMGRNQADQALSSQGTAAAMGRADQEARARAKAARRAGVAKFLTQGISAAGMAFGPSLGGGGGGSGTGFGFDGPNQAAPYTPGIDI